MNKIKYGETYYQHFPNSDQTMILPTCALLDSYDMAPIADLFDPVPEVQYLHGKSGVEHYRFLRWIGEYYNNIIEIGTYMGLSSTCLAYSEMNVTTFDITDRHIHWKERPATVYPLIHNEGQHWFWPGIIYADVIFIDAMHDGILEREIYYHLLEWEWPGIVIYDDIDYNEDMRNLWASIDHPGKLDITHIGHHSGTGLINFSI